MSTQNRIMIYTDGACSNNPGGPGGWAATLNYEKGYNILSGNEPSTTNNRMELTAVVEALKHVVPHGHKAIVINSDSAYVINAINKEWIEGWKQKGWKTKAGKDLANCDLWIELYKLLKKSNTMIFFNKVAGHKGNTFNEIADTEAKKEVIKAKRKLEWEISQQSIKGGQ